MSQTEEKKENPPQHKQEEPVSQSGDEQKPAPAAQEQKPQTNTVPSRPQMPSPEEMLQHKEKMMPLVRFLKKHGLKFKHANCMNVRVEYFRMDVFQALIEEQKEQIKKQGLQELVDNIGKDLVLFKRPPNSEKLKYPQALTPVKPGSQEGKFASFKFDTTESKKIYVIMVVLLILAVVLFPLWPYELKYGVWLVCLYFMILIVGIIILRLILYVFAASFGVSFWVLPNLFGDYGVLDSLRPIYSVERWENDVVTVILRVLAFGTFLYYCHSIYQEPEFYLQNLQATKVVIDDVHDWGVSKIKGEAGNFSQRALTMENILNETQDAFDDLKVDYTTSFDEPATEENGSTSEQATETKESGAQQQASKQPREQTVEPEAAPQL